MVLSRSLCLALIGALLVPAPAWARPKAREVVDPPPAWRTDDGRKEVWWELARWYIDNNLPQEALDMVQRLRDDGEDTPELRTIQARALAAQGVPDEARVVLLDVLDKNPRYAPAMQAMGVVLADLGEHQAAIETLTKALRVDPDHAPTRNNLGYLLFAYGRCAEAVDQLEQVIEADSTNARYRNNLAFALVCADDEQRALKLFRSISGEAEARYNMGLAYERLDKIPSAILQYEHALRVDPNFTRASEALAGLQEGAAQNPEAQ